MKLFFYICLFSFLITPLFGQTLEEYEKEVFARNGIAAKTQWDYDYQNDQPSKTGKKSIRTTYNKNGQIMSVEAFNSKGQVISSEKYDYDVKGNKIMYERNSPTGKYNKNYAYNSQSLVTLETGFNGSEAFRTTYEYNLKGLPIEIIYMLGTRVDEKRIYDYVGSTADVNVYKANDQLVSKLKLVYDSQNRISKEIIYGTNNSELEKKIYAYASNNNILKEEKYRAGSFYYRITYTYDSKGNLLKVTEESPSKEKFDKKVYSYDSSGKLTEFKWRRQPDEEFSVKEFTYDEKGLCISEYTFYPATKFKVLSKYKYEFR